MELDERKKVTISLELAASFSEASVIASWLVTQLCAPDPKLMLFCIENPAASLLWGNRHIKGPLERLKSALPCEVFDDVVCLCMFGEDEETGKETTLAELSDGAYFGERSLLKGETRFASIRADTKLQTMCITRLEFEMHFGPLKDLVPDKY